MKFTKSECGTSAITAGELRAALAGVPDDTLVMMNVHDMEDVDEITAITGVEVIKATPDAEPDYVELYLFGWQLPESERTKGILKLVK